MIYPIGGCSTRPIIHVAGADAGADADADETYGAYAAAENNACNNTNNSNNTANNHANNNAKDDGKTRLLKQKPGKLLPVAPKRCWPTWTFAGHQ